MLPNMECVAFAVRWFSVGLYPSVGLNELWYQATCVGLVRGTAPLSGSQLYDWLLSIANLP